MRSFKSLAAKMFTGLMITLLTGATLGKPAIKTITGALIHP
jgi:hypothetical protein